MNMSLGKLWETVKNKKPGALQSTGSQSPHHLVTKQLQVTKESISPIFPFSLSPRSVRGFHEESDFRIDYFFHLEKHTMP